MAKLIEHVEHSKHSELAHRVGERLRSGRWRLTTAESCTGGWIAQEITAVAGSSEWFEYGFITYANRAKQDLLGVPSTILVQHGAVSEATVRAMAIGALARSAAQFSIAVSGIAGPGGGSVTKPVGTVWLAWGAAHSQVMAREYHFSGDRQSVRHAAVTAGLQGLLDFVEECSRES